MKAYKVIQIVEETYYIEAENEDDALAKVYSCEVEPRRIEEIGIRISELIE
tara:strand:+ start:316 stop:468 length:153 start_codon:yes stop_codon:yes gene_type:complete